MVRFRFNDDVSDEPASGRRQGQASSRAVAAEGGRQRASERANDDGGGGDDDEASLALACNRFVFDASFGALARVECSSHYLQTALGDVPVHPIKGRAEESERVGENACRLFSVVHQKFSNRSRPRDDAAASLPLSHAPAPPLLAPKQHQRLTGFQLGFRYGT